MRCSYFPLTIQITNASVYILNSFQRLQIQCEYSSMLGMEWCVRTQHWMVVCVSAQISPFCILIVRRNVTGLNKFLNIPHRDNIIVVLNNGIAIIALFGHVDRASACRHFDEKIWHFFLEYTLFGWRWMKHKKSPIQDICTKHFHFNNWNFVLIFDAQRIQMQNSFMCEAPFTIIVPIASVFAFKWQHF